MAKHINSLRFKAESLENQILQQAANLSGRSQVIVAVQNVRFPRLEHGRACEVMNPNVIQKRDKICRRGIPRMSRSFLVCELPRSYLDQHVVKGLSQPSL